MKVIRAKHAGACYGVQRALDMAQVSVMDGGEAYTLGPPSHSEEKAASMATERSTGETSARPSP